MKHDHTSLSICYFFLFFFFNDTATTEIYTLSLHDALPIWCRLSYRSRGYVSFSSHRLLHDHDGRRGVDALLTRSEEHTSELQSHSDLVCRLLLEKKNKNLQTSRSIIPQYINRVEKVSATSH